MLSTRLTVPEGGFWAAGHVPGRPKKKFRNAIESLRNLDILSSLSQEVMSSSFLALLGQHLAGELGLGLLELVKLFLGEDLGELLKVFGLNLALLDACVG